MEHKIIEQTIIFLRDNNTNLKSCSDDEINKLEAHYDILLPDCYKQFLKLMGNGSPNYMRGSDYTYNWLFEMKQGANEILLESNMKELPIDTFVFWMHQGYQFCYFHLDRHLNNPAVYYYNECYKDLGIIKVSDSLTDFLYNPGILGDTIKNAK